MAKLKIKNLKNVQSAIKKSIIRSARGLKKGVAETVVDQIRKESTSAASSTIEARKYLEKGNRTHPEYNRGNINITFTGEQLDDLKKKPTVDTTGGKVEYVIEHTGGKHKKYKKANGKPMKGSAKKYTDIQGYLEKLGYNYMTFSSKSKKRVIEFIRTNIFKNLK